MVVETRTHDHRSPFRRLCQLSFQTMRSNHTHRQLSTATVVSTFVQCLFYIFSIDFIGRHTDAKSYKTSHLRVVKWIDTNGSHKWRVFRSCYRKTARLEFETTNTSCCSDAFTDWSIRSCDRILPTWKCLQLFRFQPSLGVVFHFGLCRIVYKPYTARLIKKDKKDKK